VAAFDPAAAARGDLDYRLLAGSPVTLFWRPSILADSEEWLIERGYHVQSLAASAWSTPLDFHRAIAAALDFPSYYGKNLDALNDCLGDVVDHAYGWPDAATGLVLVFQRYDRFAANWPDLAQAVLDIIARHSRRALLIGERLICLVQSDDPAIQFAPVGAAGVLWNGAEWLDSQRGPRA
jgi:Barstar (barnase inhibitor)